MPGADHRSVGLLLLGLGVLLVVIGALAYAGALSWLGRLPGDVRIEGEHTRVYVPITSMIVVSVVISLVVRLVQRWFG